MIILLVILLIIGGAAIFAINAYNKIQRLNIKKKQKQNNDAFNDGMTNGYWKDGTLYSPNYSIAYYDPLQIDSDSYKY